VVSSSRSTFPRHWAWGHGARTLCGAGLGGAGNAPAGAPPLPGCAAARHWCQAGAGKLTRRDFTPIGSDRIAGLRPAARTLLPGRCLTSWGVHISFLVACGPHASANFQFMSNKMAGSCVKGPGDN
jgi:hypothetical protein